MSCFSYCRDLCAKFKSKKHSTVYWLKELLHIISSEQSYTNLSYGNMLINTKHFHSNSFCISIVKIFPKNWQCKINLLLIPYSLMREHCGNNLNFCVLSLINQANITLFCAEFCAIFFILFFILLAVHRQREHFRWPTFKLFLHSPELLQDRTDFLETKASEWKIKQQSTQLTKESSLTASALSDQEDSKSKIQPCSFNCTQLYWGAFGQCRGSLLYIMSPSATTPPHPQPQWFLDRKCYTSTKASP